MKSLVCFAISMLLLLTASAQSEEPDMDSIIKSLRTEFLEDQIEATQEDLFNLKLYHAWETRDETFIFQTIDSLLASNSLNGQHFWGMDIINGVFPEATTKAIIEIKDKLLFKYARDTAINKYLFAYELAFAQFYYEPEAINKLTSTVLELLDTDQLQLDEGSLSILYSLRKTVLELEGKIKERDAFTLLFYKKYPKELKIDYLLSQHYIGNYQEVVNEIKSATDATPILLMLAAQSHLKLKNDILTQTFFDELLNRYNDPKNTEKKRGGLSTVFEQEMVGVTIFLEEDIEAMTAYYFNQNNKVQGCSALEMLMNSIANNNEPLASDEPGKDYLIGPVRKELEQKNQIKEAIEKKERYRKITEWKKYCD